MLVDLDEQYVAASLVLKLRNPNNALDHLFQALQVGEDIDVNYTKGVIESLFVLLGENHKLTKAYNQELLTNQSS